MASLEERFWQKVDKPADPDACWGWRGGKHRRGYGYIWAGRDHAQAPKNLTASRVSWELHNGQIPAGMIVCHACDNPSCTNPAHLFLGTYKDNSEDMVRKGRYRLGRRDNLRRGADHWSAKHPEKIMRGETHASARLTADQVREIRRLRSEGMTLTAIADRFGINYSMVSMIAQRKRWKSLE